MDKKAKEKTPLFFLMEDRGIKTSWLAQEIGVTPQTVRNYCNAERGISLPMKRLISQALDVDVNSI